MVLALQEDRQQLEVRGRGREGGRGDIGVQCVSLSLECTKCSVGAVRRLQPV